MIVEFMLADSDFAFGKSISRAIHCTRPRTVGVLLLAAFMGFNACWAAGNGAKVTEQQQPPSKSAPGNRGIIPKGVRTEWDIQYVPGGDESQRLDLYLPERASDKPLPIIVWIHGGGWNSGGKAGCPPVRMVTNGYAAASVEYRFSQKAIFPAQIQDCQAAIRWLRANSKKYNIDPDRIGVWGGSAGGHLAALLGTSGGKKAFAPVGGNEDQSDRVNAVCEFFGPTDFNSVMHQAANDKTTKNIFNFNTPSDPYSCLIGAHLGEDKQKGDAVSPVHYVSSDNPPILILHGTRDALVPIAQSEEFAAALKEKGVNVLLQRLPGSGHGGPMFNRPAVNNLINAFFDKHLKNTDTLIELVPEADLAVK